MNNLGKENSYTIQNITNDLNKNLSLIKKTMSETDDLMVKDLIFKDQKCILIYLDSMIDEQTINSIIIEPMLQQNAGTFEQLAKASKFQLSADLTEITSSLMLGYCIILEENQSFVYMASVPKSQGRSIEEPLNEKTTKGSHEGFVESLHKPFT